MSQSIFLRGIGDTLIEMTERPYDSEALLQKLLADYPALLAGGQVDGAAPRRWALIKREVAVPDREGSTGRWSVDHVFLDQDGIPTLVEVKRSTDTRIRREVIGQMLDYAANAVAYWPVESLRATFEAACTQRGATPDAILSDSLGHADADAFWQMVKTNLQAGRIRMIFVADDIPLELRRVVEFLNEQMDPAEVLAIEVRQYASDELQTLVPRVIGQTAESQQRKGVSPSAALWDESRFLSDLASRKSAAEVEIARRLLEWARARGATVWWGKGSRSGSFTPMLRRGSTDHYIFTVYSYGSVEVLFQWYAAKPPFADENLRRAMLQKLNAIPGVSISEDSLKRRPNVSLTTLTASSTLQQFLDVFDWYVVQVTTR